MSNHLNKAAETERTSLALLTEKDFPDMMAMFLDPDNSQYIRHLNLRKKEEYEGVLHNRMEQIRTGAGFHWVGRIKDTGAFVGALNLSQIPDTHIVQLGFQLVKKLWGQGFATEMARKVLEIGTAENGYGEIYGVFEKGNQGSQKVLMKLGFREETKRILDEENIVTFVYRPVTKQ
jgi:ribosomal-protein-alanine N-acetyltransferase